MGAAVLPDGPPPGATGRLPLSPGHPILATGPQGTFYTRGAGAFPALPSGQSGG